MVNKKISPVTFSDESVEKNEQVCVKSINRVAPVDPDSGSGSGSGGISGIGTGSVHGTLKSKYGCEWNVTGNFSWYADYAYETWVGDDGFRYNRLELRIELINVQLSCAGLAHRDGKFSYLPSQTTVLLLRLSNSQPNIITENEQTLCTFKYTSSPEKFYVTKIQHNEDGTTTDFGLSPEEITIYLDVFFYVTPNFYTNQNPDISVRSCDVY